jgi:hypothetical protein
VERGEIHAGGGGLAEQAIPEEADELWPEDGDEHVGWFCVSTDRSRVRRPVASSSRPS